jgi:hypothetical protein
MALRSILELGVLEAYELLVAHFAIEGLPPLEALENEDWGRDFLLSHFLEIPAGALAEAGLTLGDEPNPPAHPQGP